jgi:hypothetical protein
VDVQADVTICSHGWLAGVQPHSHPHWPVAERPLSVLGSGHRVGCTGKRNKKGVALGVNLDTAMAREYLAQGTAVFGECIRIGVEQLIQESRRTLYIGE